jgi:AcrR family transcriptional regulator
MLRRRRVLPAQQALRRAPKPHGDATRERVIEAAVACIAELGFHGASTTRIARRAGLTWGVLQYHFGDKHGLLAATLERVFDDFRNHLRAAAVPRGAVRDRVARLVDVAWDWLRRPAYRASMEILRNTARTGSALDVGGVIEVWARATGTLWDDAFPEWADRRERSEAAKYLLFAALRGFAEDLALDGRAGGRDRRREFAALTDAVAFLLREGASSR